LDLTTSIIEEKINWWIRFAGYLLEVREKRISSIITWEQLANKISGHIIPVS